MLRFVLFFACAVEMRHAGEAQGVARIVVIVLHVHNHVVVVKAADVSHHFGIVAFEVEIQFAAVLFPVARFVETVAALRAEVSVVIEGPVVAGLVVAVVAACHLHDAPVSAEFRGRKEPGVFIAPGEDYRGEEGEQQEAQFMDGLFHFNLNLNVIHCLKKIQKYAFSVNVQRFCAKLFSFRPF